MKDKKNIKLISIPIQHPNQFVEEITVITPITIIIKKSTFWKMIFLIINKIFILIL